MARYSNHLPLEGTQLVEVRGGRPRLSFDDPKHSVLDIHGEFHVRASGAESYFSPLEPGVVNVIESFLEVPIVSARADRHGQLRISFEDGRELFVPDGPFENWHYTNDEGLTVHGGVGRCVFVQR